MRAGVNAMVVAAGVAALLAGCTGRGSAPVASPPPTGVLGGEVVVAGEWSGADLESFEAMVEPWQRRTGALVRYSTETDLEARVTSGIASGDLPDVVISSNLASVRDWHAQGALRRLDFLDRDLYANSTPPGMAPLGEVGDQLAAVFVRASVKGLVFHDSGVWAPQDVPSTWDDMIRTAQSKRATEEAVWCLGLADGASSGGPGADWIEAILLRQAGEEAYDRWVSGELEWGSPQVRMAFTTFGEVLAAAGGGAARALEVGPAQATDPMFASPPGCLLRLGESLGAQRTIDEAGASEDQFDLFRLPDFDSEHAGAVTGAGSLAGLLTDTPQARSLIAWLVGPEAQAVWAGRGGYLAPNQEVPLDAYPEGADREAARVLDEARVFRLDGSDAMARELATAFDEAVLEFARHPGQLDQILLELDQARLK